jgi:hypothetical protein
MWLQPLKRRKTREFAQNGTQYGNKDGETATLTESAAFLP